MSKIVHVVSDMNFGGVGRYLSLLDDHIKQGGDEFYVIMPRGSVLKDSLQHMEVIEADGLADQSFSWQGVKAIKAIVKTIKPDIIHTHGALSGRLVGKWLKIPTVFTKHTLSQPSHGLKGHIKKGIHRYLKSRAIAVSKGAYENLKAEGFRDKDITLIYNGVGHRKSCHDLGCKNRLLMVGRLETIKGPMACLDMIAALKATMTQDFELVLAGDGSLMDALKARVAAEQLPVKFLGHVKAIDDLYPTAHVVINTSETEALPYAIIEGMSHQKPVVAYDIPGIREVVVEGKTGYIIPYLDHKTFAQKVQSLLEDPDLCKTMGTASQGRVDQMFSITQMIHKLMKVYEAMYENNK